MFPSSSLSVKIQTKVQAYSILYGASDGAFEVLYGGQHTKWDKVKTSECFPQPAASSGITTLLSLSTYFTSLSCPLPLLFFIYLFYLHYISVCNLKKIIIENP